MSVQCPACGKQNRSGAKFCNMCGTSLTAPVPDAGLVCTACGSRSHRPGAKFCTECGGPLSRVAPPGGHCPVCAAPIPAADARFCPECRASLTGSPAASRCASCGEPHRPGAAFCTRCGAPVSAGITPAAEGSTASEGPAAPASGEPAAVERTASEGPAAPASGEPATVERTAPEGHAAPVTGEPATVERTAPEGPAAPVAGEPVAEGSTAPEGPAAPVVGEPAPEASGEPVASGRVKTSPRPTYTCASCGEEIRPDAVFCVSCGAPAQPVQAQPVETPDACPFCGETRQQPGALFCTGCGALLSPKPEPTRAVPEEKRSMSTRQRVIFVLVGAAVLAAAIFFLVRTIRDVNDQGTSPIPSGNSPIISAAPFPDTPGDGLETGRDLWEMGAPRQ